MLPCISAFAEYERKHAQDLAVCGLSQQPLRNTSYNELKKRAAKSNRRNDNTHGFLRYFLKHTLTNITKHMKTLSQSIVFCTTPHNNSRLVHFIAKLDRHTLRGGRRANLFFLLLLLLLLVLLDVTNYLFRLGLSITWLFLGLEGRRSQSACPQEKLMLRHLLQLQINPFRVKGLAGLASLMILSQPC